MPLLPDSFVNHALQRLFKLTPYKYSLLIEDLSEWLRDLFLVLSDKTLSAVARVGVGEAQVIDGSVGFAG